MRTEYFRRAEQWNRDQITVALVPIHVEKHAEACSFPAYSSIPVRRIPMKLINMLLRLLLLSVAYTQYAKPAHHRLLTGCCNPMNLIFAAHKHLERKNCLRQLSSAQLIRFVFLVSAVIFALIYNFSVDARKNPYSKLFFSIVFIVCDTRACIIRGKRDWCDKFILPKSIAFRSTEREQTIHWQIVCSFDANQYSIKRNAVSFATPNQAVVFSHWVRSLNTALHFRFYSFGTHNGNRQA